jgi:hypothetical protein
MTLIFLCLESRDIDGKNTKEGEKVTWKNSIICLVC